MQSPPRARNSRNSVQTDPMPYSNRSSALTTATDLSKFQHILLGGLHEAAARGNVLKLKQSLRQAANQTLHGPSLQLSFGRLQDCLTLPDEQGRTVLEVATDAGRIEVIELLTKVEKHQRASNYAISLARFCETLAVRMNWVQRKSGVVRKAVNFYKGFLPLPSKVSMIVLRAHVSHLLAILDDGNMYN